MINLTLHSIIGHLLNENASHDEVLDAIREKYYVRINYDDGKEDNGGNSKGVRIIQPVAIGTTKKGYPVVRAFQLNGNSRRGAPKWKFFRLDRIVSWRPMKNKKFFTPPDASYGKYNTMGDKTMGTFFDNAKFSDLEDPLLMARATTQNILHAPKVSTKNVSGPITANQQWKKNVYTSQPNSKKYADIAKNVDSTSNKMDDYWADYEKALQQQSMQNTNSGPIDNSYDENFYDVNDVDFDENNFIDNKNRR